MLDNIVGSTRYDDSVVEVTYAARTVDESPTHFRFARYPNCRLILQGGFVWKDKWESGVEWRDIEMVEVDSEGTAIVTD